MDFLTPTTLWLLLALVLIALEMVTTGFLLACFAVGSLLSWIVCLFGVGIWGQVFAFAAGSLLSFFLIRPLFHKHSKVSPSNTEALIGHKALVTHTICAEKNGRITVDGDSWPAKLAEGELPMAPGETVEIVAHESIVMIVARPPKDF